MITNNFVFNCVCVYYAILIILWIGKLHDQYSLSSVKKGIEVPSVKDFQFIGNKSNKVTVYSAYYDEYLLAGRPSVVVISGLKIRSSESYHCILYDKDGFRQATSRAKVRLLKFDTWFEEPYVSSYIFCKVDDFLPLPSFVSIVESEVAKYIEDSDVVNVLKIKYNENSGGKVKFAVCVESIFNYERPFRVIEWIEFHRLMGVQKFTFYNDSIGPQTSCIMKSYGDLLEILPWSSPYNRYAYEIMGNAQKILLHDCIQRYKDIAEFLIHVDLDEMIIPFPFVGDNYFKMMTFFSKKMKANYSLDDMIAGYSFQNGQFFSHLKNPKLQRFAIKGYPEAENILKHLTITNSVYRKKHTDIHTTRSKLFMRPEKIIEAGVHEIVEKEKNTIVVEISDNVAYSHHYRDHCKLCDDAGKIIEESAVRFGKQLAFQIAEHLDTKAKHCKISIP